MQAQQSSERTSISFVGVPRLAVEVLNECILNNALFFMIYTSEAKEVHMDRFFQSIGYKLLEFFCFEISTTYL